MNLEKFFSIIIIVVLVVAPLFKPAREKVIKDTFILNESQVSGIKQVNINVESNASGVAVSFSNSMDSIETLGMLSPQSIIQLKGTPSTLI